MTVQEKYYLIMLTIYLGALVFGTIMTYRRYREYKANLMVHQNAVIVSPSMFKFLLYGFAYELILSFPALLFFWVIEPDHEIFWGILLNIPAVWLWSTIPAHPYYALSVYEGKIEGARVWGPLWGSLWGWGGSVPRRIKIDSREIDKEKTLRQHLLHLLGIVIFHSVSGRKILTIGLKDSQISQVLEMRFDGGN